MLVWAFWIFSTPMFDTGDSFPHWMWPTLASFRRIPVPVLSRLLPRSQPGHLVCIRYSSARVHDYCRSIPAARVPDLCVRFFPVLRPLGDAARNMLVVFTLYALEWRLLGFPWMYLISATLVGFAVGS